MFAEKGTAKAVPFFGRWRRPIEVPKKTLDFLGKGGFDEAFKKRRLECYRITVSTGAKSN